MKFIIITSFLVSFVAAAPAAISPLDAVSKNDESARLFARANVVCAIVKSTGPVNCRSGPHLSASIAHTVAAGSLYTFSCYVNSKGDCYEGNCTWDYLTSAGCYVNGYYTDSGCSIAALGKC